MENSKEIINKKRLGRGIGSLLGGDLYNQENEKISEQNISLNIQKANNEIIDNINDLKIWSVAVDKIVPGVYQPRKNFNKENIAELAQSIKENGIIQPITVRKRAQGGFEIIAGERRWRAAQVAGLHEVPVVLKNINDTEALQISIIENVQREDLDPIEEAEAYQRLMQEFALSQQQVSEKVGKERSSVANALRLIALPNEVKDLLSLKKINTGHAKVLLSLQDKNELIKTAKMCAEKQMSVRALEQTIKLNTNLKNTLSKATQEENSPLKGDLSQRLATELAEQLQKSLGTKIDINYKNGKGQLTIHFYSDEQLNTIYEKVNK